MVGFRSETMQEFLSTKKRLGIEQAQAIDAERRRCNTMLGLKQSELETLRENLAQKTKHAENLDVRCEFLAFWAYQGRTMARLRTVQFRCFLQLKKYREWRKHSRQMVEHRLRNHKQQRLRQIWQGWIKSHMTWREEKKKEDFNKAVKLQIQSISANYSKEIEMLRKRLDDANL